MANHQELNKSGIEGNRGFGGGGFNPGRSVFGCTPWGGLGRGLGQILPDLDASRINPPIDKDAY